MLTFELSDNIIEKDLVSVANEVHSILANILPTKLESCKTRIIRHSEFLIGNGDKYNAFLHVSIEVMPGRPIETLKLASQKITAILPGFFKESSSKLNLKISVAVENLPETYCKC